METAGVSTILIRAEFYCIQTPESIKGREPLSKPEDQMKRLIKYQHVGSLWLGDLQPPAPPTHMDTEPRGSRQHMEANGLICRGCFSLTPTTNSFFIQRLRGRTLTWDMASPPLLQALAMLSSWYTGVCVLTGVCSVLV